MFCFFRALPLHSARWVATINSTLPWCKPERNKGIFFTGAFVPAHRGCRRKLLCWKAFIFDYSSFKRMSLSERISVPQATRKGLVLVVFYWALALCVSGYSSFPFVGSLPWCWWLSADLAGSSVIVEWISDTFQRAWNLSEYFPL